MRAARAIVKYRIVIFITGLLMLAVSVYGIVNTRVNYDMLTYLPQDMETVIGQDILLDEFGKGAFSFIVIENMPDRDVAALKEKIEDTDHVESVIWYDSVLDLTIPMEILPDSIYDAFNTENSTLMAVFFDSSTSEDVTMDAIRQIRETAGKQCFISGMSAVVTDLKDLCEQEEPVYVALAVACALVVMLLFMDSWLIPFVFLLSIGICIVINLGSNYFLGEISYITKAMAAVLQLAVTMDYSIFLWHSYNQELLKTDNHEEAMALAIHSTFSSVLGSSITTIAGFIALCFMSFTIGKDLGIVMAKGVLLGVIGCVTLLPGIILMLDKPLHKTMHKSLIPDMKGFAGGVIKVFPVFLIIFVLLAVPAYYGYSKTNSEVYYDMSECLPQDMECVIANSRLKEEFDISSTHMILTDASLPSKAVSDMTEEMEDVKGVRQVLSLEHIIGPEVPAEILTDSIKEIVESDHWKLMIINSEYSAASDEVSRQIDELGAILKKYDPSGMLIGEASCMKDMIETTDYDFKVVTWISIIAIFVIILLVERSLTLPVILIAVIELAIFINLGLPHYLGQSLPFIAPICISTIQLGATVDYAILMTTTYKKARIGGNRKKEAVTQALRSSARSIIISGLGLFAATFGVAVYSNIDIVSSMCMLMARGALVSVLMVLFILPAMLMLLDRLICATTIGMTKICKREKEERKITDKAV